MEQLKTFLGYSPMQLIIPFILFIVLSPGIIMTVPPSSYERRWFTEETSMQAVIIHGLVFGIIYFFIRRLLPQLFE